MRYLTYVFIAMFASGCGILSPVMNDITTTQDPVPELLALDSVPSDLKLEYNPDFWSMQQKHYPEIQALILKSADAQASWNKLVELIQEKIAGDDWNWEILQVKQSPMRLQAVATTALLSFKDDLVIELRNESDVWRLHMRSKSRIGRSDFGANAKRIRMLFSLAVSSGLGFLDTNASFSD